MIKPRPIYCPNVILLHAEGNSLYPIKEAKNIVEKITKAQKVITVVIHDKISDVNESQIVVKNFDYSIYKETRKKSSNIASEFLRAGSDFVYYIKAEANEYRTAFIHIYDILSNEYPIICVANNLAHHLKAGAIVVYNPDQLSRVKEKVYKPELLLSDAEFKKANTNFIEGKIVF